MGRTKGSQNKAKPAATSMPAEQRVKLLADIILEIITAEQEASKGE